MKCSLAAQAHELFKPAHCRSSAAPPASVTHPHFFFLHTRYQLWLDTEPIQVKMKFFSFSYIAEFKRVRKEAKNKVRSRMLCNICIWILQKISIYSPKHNHYLLWIIWKQENLNIKYNNRKISVSMTCRSPKIFKANSSWYLSVFWTMLILTTYLSW